MEILKEYKSYLCADYDVDYYTNLLKGSSLSSLTEEELKQALLNSKFYTTFLNHHRELIKSPYITGKVIPVNMEFMSYGLKSFEKIREYYQNLGIRYEYSDEHEDFKKELINTMMKDNSNKEKVKKLLEEKKYI